MEFGFWAKAEYLFKKQLHDRDNSKLFAKVKTIIIFCW